MVDHVLNSVAATVGVWMYLIAGGLCFAEAALLVGMVLPGETALLVGGVLSAHSQLSLPLMMAVAAVAAIAGDSVGYALGKRFGPPLRRSRLGEWVGEPRWNSVDGFLHRHGGKAVLMGRFTAVFRALVPSMAGMSRMRYRTFVTWNAIGGLVWGPMVVLLGYLFYRSLNVVGETLTWAPFVLIALVVAAVGGLHWRRRRNERASVPELADTDSA